MLDRVLIKNNTEEPYLELDPNHIKSATAKHFKHIAGSINQDITNPISPMFSQHWPHWK